jgi:hypothetical protein
MHDKFAFATLVVLIGFELPKCVFWAISGHASLFPQFDAQKTDSSLVWILVHQLLGIVLIYATALPITHYFQQIDCMHHLFLASILMNYQRLANLKYGAVINLALVFVLSVAFSTKRFKLYNAVLTIPIWMGPVKLFLFFLTAMYSYHVGSVMYALCYMAYVVVIALWLHRHWPEHGA